MACLQPILISDPRGLGNGFPQKMEVPCGKCLGCLKTRQNDYSIRVSEELLKHGCNCFVTLTYRDESLPLAVDESSGELRGSLCRKHIQDFMKVVRSNLVRSGFLSPKVFLCGEYGTKTFRPHYHLCLAGVHSTMLQSSLDYWYDRYGFYNIQDIGSTYTDKRKVGLYVGKYASKGVFISESPLLLDCMEKPFLMASNFLGLDYIKDRLDYFSLVNESTHYSSFDDWVEDFASNFVYRSGNFTYSMPSYYKDYFYSHASDLLADSIYSKTGYNPYEQKFSYKIVSRLKGFTKVKESTFIPSVRDQISLSLYRLSLKVSDREQYLLDSVGLRETYFKLSSEDLAYRDSVSSHIDRSLNSFYLRSSI